MNEDQSGKWSPLVILVNYSVLFCTLLYVPAIPLLLVYFMVIVCTLHTLHICALIFCSELKFVYITVDTHGN